jgi:hypothetical protein
MFYFSRSRSFKGPSTRSWRIIDAARALRSGGRLTAWAGLAANYRRKNGLWPS